MTSHETQYINTDLELRSNAPLLALHRELEQDCCILYYGAVDSKTWLLTAEANTPEVAFTPNYRPENHIRELLRVFSQLSKAAKMELRSCHTRMFDMGFSCGYSERDVYQLSPELIKAIAEANCSVMVTLYSAATPY